MSPRLLAYSGRVEQSGVEGQRNRGMEGQRNERIEGWKDGGGVEGQRDGRT